VDLRAVGVLITASQGPRWVGRPAGRQEVTCQTSLPLMHGPYRCVFHTAIGLVSAPRTYDCAGQHTEDEVEEKRNMREVNRTYLKMK
jgi:hypothetical protein